MSNSELRILVPGPSANIEEAFAVDLSHLGLNMGQVQDASAVIGTPAQFDKGLALDFFGDQGLALRIMTFRYASALTASDNFRSLAAWAENNCS